MRPNEVQDDATTRQRLEAIRTRILAGEDFGALASVTSEDPGSASRGGDLGWNVPGHLRPGVRERPRRAQGERDQRAIPHAVRMAYRSAPGPAHARPERRAAPPARADRLAREQGGRGNRAVAATTARRGLRRDQESLNARRIVVTTGEPAGIGPDLSLAAALVDWPCELVFAGDPALLAARAELLRISLRPTEWREGARPVPHRAGTLPVLAVEARPRGIARPAGSRQCALCARDDRCGGRGLPRRALRRDGDRRRCRSPRSTTPAFRSRATRNTSPQRAAARTR